MHFCTKYLSALTDIKSRCFRNSNLWKPQHLVETTASVFIGILAVNALWFSADKQAIHDKEAADLRATCFACFLFSLIFFLKINTFNN